LKTGAVLGPPAQKGVPSYKIVVEGDDIKAESIESAFAPWDCWIAESQRLTALVIFRPPFLGALGISRERKRHPTQALGSRIGST
jgi:hypothetical protein